MSFPSKVQNFDCEVHWLESTIVTTKHSNTPFTFTSTILLQMFMDLLKFIPFINFSYVHTKLVAMWVAYIRGLFDHYL